MTRFSVLSAAFILLSVLTGGCKATGIRPEAAPAMVAQVPPAEKFDFMGCRKDAVGCDSDCTKLAGVTLEAPDICPKGGFDGALACFCEKDPVR